MAAREPRLVPGLLLVAVDDTPVGHDPFDIVVQVRLTENIAAHTVAGGTALTLLCTLFWVAFDNLCPAFL
eukprot:SAG22_NODE_288_length_12949_cov_163.316265_9_plen_70_part_00